MAGVNCIPCDLGFAIEYLPLLNCNSEKNKRKSGIQQIAFIKCDSVIDDMTDVTEWNDLKQVPGALIRTPGGLGSWAKPNSTSQKTGCNENTITDKTLVIAFKTYNYDNDTFADAEFMCKLNGSWSSYTLLILGCDGNLYYSADWTTGANPGLGMTLLDSWDDNPETGLQAKNFEITVNILDTCYTLIKPSEALKTAIFAGTSNTSGGG